MQVVWQVQRAFEVFGVEIRYYTVFFALAFILGYGLVRWQIVRGGGPEKAADQMLVGGVFAAIFGGRFAHVLFYEFPEFVADPMMMFRFSGTGMASHGSATGLVIWVGVVALWNRAPIVDALDRLAPAAALAAGLVRLGNLFNSEIVGRPTDQTWGMSFPLRDGADALFRYPTQLFEFGLGIAVFAALLGLDRRYGELRPRGDVSRPLFYGANPRRVLESASRYRSGFSAFDGPGALDSPGARRMDRDCSERSTAPSSWILCNLNFREPFDARIFCASGWMRIHAREPVSGVELSGPAQFCNCFVWIGPDVAT